MSRLHPQPCVLAYVLIASQRPPPRSTEDKWVHDAYSGGGRGGGRGRGGFNGSGGRPAADVAGTGVGFTGVSPRIEVVGLHYEVTPQDLKVRSPPAVVGGGTDLIDDLCPSWNTCPRPNHPCKRLTPSSVYHPLGVFFSLDQSHRGIIRA